MNLNDALAEFDAAETTLSRLEVVWQHLSGLVPGGIAFVGGSSAAIEYEGLCRAFGELVGGLPAIDGWTITESPWDLDEIAQSRLDAQELGDVEAMASVERKIDAPAKRSVSTASASTGLGVRSFVREHNTYSQVSRLSWPHS